MCPLEDSYIAHYQVDMCDTHKELLDTQSIHQYEFLFSTVEFAE